MILGGIKLDTIFAGVSCLLSFAALFVENIGGQTPLKKDYEMLTRGFGQTLLRNKENISTRPVRTVIRRYKTCRLLLMQMAVRFGNPDAGADIFRRCFG